MCSWSPDGKYVAVVNRGSNTVQVFAFSGEALTKVGGDVATGSAPRSCSWSPDGKYLAVANQMSGSLQVFSFSGNVLTPITTTAAVGGQPYSCSWSPDGSFIAVVNYSGNALQIFPFSGNSLTQVGSYAAAGGTALSCSWSPDGKYIAVGSSPDRLRLFAFTGNTPEKVGVDVVTGKYLAACFWSPDGKYVAAVNANIGTLQIFVFSGGTLTQLGANAITSPSAASGSWSPDGKYIAVANNNNMTIQIFFAPLTPTFLDNALTVLNNAGTYRATEVVEKIAAIKAEQMRINPGSKIEEAIALVVNSDTKQEVLENTQMVLATVGSYKTTEVAAQQQKIDTEVTARAFVKDVTAAATPSALKTVFVQDKYKQRSAALKDRGGLTKKVQDFLSAAGI